MVSAARNERHIERRGDPHQVSERISFHLSHDLATVSFDRDLADAELCGGSELRAVVTNIRVDAWPAQVAPELPVREFVLEHVLRQGQRALPVVEADHLVGLMSVTDAKDLAQEAWATTPVSAAMTRMPLKTLGPDASLAAALQLMVETGLHQLPIVQDRALVGMVSRADVMRYMHSGLALSERRSAQPELTAAPAHG